MIHAIQSSDTYIQIIKGIAENRKKKASVEMPLCFALCLMKNQQQKKRQN